MAITTQMRTDVANLYVALFGRAPERDGLGYWVNQLDAGKSLAAVAQEMYNTDPARATYPTFLTNEEIIGRFYSNVLGRTADADGLAYWTAKLNATGATKGSVIAEMITAVRAYAGTDAAALASKALFENKVTVGLYYAVDLGGNDVTKAASILTGVTSAASSVDAAKTTAGTSVGQTFTFTTGVDTFTGGNGNDTFVAADVAGVGAWTTGDTVNGGAGTDSFTVTANGNIAIPTAATVTNVETANLTSGGSITANTTSWTGLTALNTTTSGAAQTLTAAATTNVTATAGAQAGTNVSVNGGNNVTITGTGTTTGTTTVGATTAAAGNVVVNVTNSTGGTTTGAIAVTGGDTVTVTSAAGNAVNTTVVQSAVTVTGDSQTTAVTVNQDAKATAAATVVGKTAGVVQITDANAASATAAGTITTVTLKSWAGDTVAGGAAEAKVNSGALTTLNLSGKGEDLTVTAGALTTAAVSTLALNLNGVTTAANAVTATGAITLDSDYTTLNINSSTAASTIASLTANGATTVNVAGDAAMTLTAQTLGAVTAINVTNTAGASFGSALGTGVTFTGGAGADAISIGSTTKAITMGAGNDTVTTSSAAVGTGGSVAAGDGVDTIIMTNALAAGADGSSTFNSKFTGFEVLQISDAFTEDALDVEGLNNVTKVILAAGVSGTAGINNIASGSTVQINADGAATPALTVGVRSALVGSTDSLTIKLQGADVDAGSVTVANVEAITIDTSDPATAAAADAGTITLVATSATSLVVTGNNGVNITNTGNAAITSFNASGVVANNTTTTTDTAAELAVTFASANDTATATVTITGGAGNDTLTGGGAKDTINGGAGADLINGGTNVDTITVGSGRDIVQIANNDDNTAGDIVGSGTGTMDTITGFSLVGTAISAVDYSSNTNFQSATSGATNLNLLNIDLTADDAGVGAGANQAIAVEGNGTGSGQAAGVTYTVTNGLLTLSGAGASTVDTLGEWLTEAAAVASTAGDILAFQFGSDTYVFAQNGTADMLVQLVGVAGTSLVEVSAATTASAGAILYADI